MGRIDTYPQGAILQPNSPVTLAYAQTVTSYASIGTVISDVPGLVVSASMGDGRRIRVTGYAPVISEGSSSIFDLILVMDGAQIQVAEGTSTAMSFTASVVLTPTAGVHTFKVQARTSSGTATLAAGAANPAYILVEDITGMPLPAATASVPVGSLGFAENSADQAVTTVVDLTGLSVNVTVPAGRTLRITGQISVQSSVGGDLIDFLIYDNGVDIKHREWRVTTTNVAESATIEVILSPSAGAHTYNLRAGRGFSATGTITIIGTSDRKGSIVVEDITSTPAAGNGAPGSTLAYAEVLANQLSLGAGPTDLTGLTTTVTVSAGRRLKITGHGQFSYSDTTTGHFVDVLEDGVDIGRVYLGGAISNASGYDEMDGSIIRTPASGTHTYKLTATRYFGAGTGTLTASSTNTAYILIEDVTGVAIPRDTNINTINYILNTTAAGGGGNTTSTTFVDYPTAIDKSFTKGLTVTSLIVQGSVGCFRTVGAGVVFWALLIGGVDYPIAQFYFNDLSSHRPVPFHVFIATGLAAGTYTARLRWRVDANTANVDGNDVVHISITEGIVG